MKQIYRQWEGYNPSQEIQAWNMNGLRVVSHCVVGPSTWDGRDRPVHCFILERDDSNRSVKEQTK